MIIRKAQTLNDLRSVWKLTYQAYLSQGYTQPLAHGMLAHFPHLDTLAETAIFMAEDEDGTLLGTVSHTDDSPVGLHVDEDFKDIADQVRAECICDGLRLGSPWRIATRPEYRGSLRVVMALLAELTAHLERHRTDVTLYTFNPKHVTFYQRIWDLRVIAERTSDAVENAPAVLMRGDLPRMLARWNSKVAKRRTSARLARQVATV